jgi:hypothetical protein
MHRAQDQIRQLSKSSTKSLFTPQGHVHGVEATVYYSYVNIYSIFLNNLCESCVI